MASISTQIGCPTHPTTHLVEDHHAGDLVCPECGLVVGDRLVDVSSEWRTFNSEKSDGVDRSRVGGPENEFLDDGDLSTSIAQMPGGSRGGYDDSGKPIYKSHKNMSSSDRNITNAFRQMSQMAERLNLPGKILTMSNRVYKQAQQSGKLKGRSSESTAAACLYIACRKEQVPRTFKEVCAVCRSSKKEIGRTYKQIVKAVDAKVDVISCEDYLSRFVSHLELPMSVQKIAMHIAKGAQERDLIGGRSPVSAAATACLIAALVSGLKPNNSETTNSVATVTGAAAVTIQAVYREWYPYFKILVPDYSGDSGLPSYISG